MPKISVVIATYERPRVLKLALQSLPLAASKCAPSPVSASAFVKN